MTASIIRVQIAEDHEVVRVGLQFLLENEKDLQVVVSSASGKQAYRDYIKYQPDVLVMDISMPDMDGLTVMHNILDRYPRSRILILSMHSGMVAEAALQQGARGFISKQSGANSLTTAIHKIMRGQRFIDADTAKILIRKKQEMGDISLSSLTRREHEVFILLVDGQSVSTIAEKLHVSIKTIYTHREHILHKLGVKSIAALTNAAFLVDFYTSTLS